MSSKVKQEQDLVSCSADNVLEGDDEDDDDDDDEDEEEDAAAATQADAAAAADVKKPQSPAADEALMSSPEELIRRSPPVRSAMSGGGIHANHRDPPVFSSPYVAGSLTSRLDLEVFKCSECSYETYNLATLTSHQKIHKLYQCDICQMKFSHAANMRRHRMRHTGFKPFECRVCLKRFFRKDHLMEHMITHSKQLPFQCPMCDKSFNRQVYFKAHLQTDHWNLPSDKICGICGHKAATIKGAKLHYTTRHAKAANTVNSSSPANSRSLAEGSLGTVTRSSLMSARLEQGPTLLTREISGHGGSTTPETSDPLSSTLSLMDGGQSAVSSSQIVFPPSLTTDTMPSFALPPLTVSDGGGANSFSPYGESPAAARFLSPTRTSRHLSGSVTLHRIPGYRYSGQPIIGNGQPAESVVIKCEPPDDILLDNSSDGSDDDDEPESALRDGGGGKAGSGHHFDGHQGTAAGSSSSRSHSETCSPNSTLDLVRMHSTNSCSPSSAAAPSNGGPLSALGTSSSAIHRQVNVGDVTITPLGGILVCAHCGIVFPDQTLYFLHKGVHSENNPWKCNICGELCRDKYDFNTHILSKAHQ